MESKQLFEMALGLASPWFLEKVDFMPPSSGISGHIDLYINFQSGWKFKDSSGGALKVHDTVTKQWKHLNFFQHSCTLHARIPRLYHADGSLRHAEVPWARPGSGFTMLFEALAVLLVENEMPVNKAAATVDIAPARLWKTG